MFFIKNGLYYLTLMKIYGNMFKYVWKKFQLLRDKVQWQHFWYIELICPSRLNLVLISTSGAVYIGLD